MSDPTRVLILSNDELLRELLAELLSQDRFEVIEAKDLAEAREGNAKRPSALLIDAIADTTLARGLLDDPWEVLGEHQPPLVVLVGSTTPADVRDHAWLDRVLPVPIQSEILIQAVRYHSSGRPRRQMRSGIQMRAAIDATFATKRTTG
jgi:DNA-binding response OmpR family regulator